MSIPSTPSFITTPDQATNVIQGAWRSLFDKSSVQWLNLGLPNLRWILTQAGALHVPKLSKYGSNNAVLEIDI
eukprot:3353996-Karenia_brevis.AAC.1